VECGRAARGRTRGGVFGSSVARRVATGGGEVEPEASRERQGGAGGHACVLVECKRPSAAAAECSSAHLGRPARVRCHQTLLKAREQIETP
jgi:hypothetical protein